MLCIEIFAALVIYLRKQYISVCWVSRICISCYCKVKVGEQVFWYLVPFGVLVVYYGLSGQPASNPEGTVSVSGL
jgi:hypothetical protein